MELAQLVESPRRRAAAALERLVELGRQVQQRQVVRDGRLVDSHPPGDLGVRFARIDARAHEPGEIDRRQAVALLVLGDLGVGVMGLRADDDGNGLEPRLLRGAQTLGAEEDPIATLLGQPMDDDRLEDPAQSDVLGELGDLLFGELGPRVARVFLEALDRDEERQPFGGARAEAGFVAEAGAAAPSSTASEVSLAADSSFASSTRSRCSTFDLFQGMRMSASCRRAFCAG